METITTRVTWPGPHSSNTIQIMVEEMTDSGKLISRASPDPYAEHTTIAVWRDLEAANEYLAFVNAQIPSPVSAEIIEN